MRTLSIASALIASLVSSGARAEDKPAGAPSARHLISGTVKLEHCDETQGWFNPNKEFGPGQPKDLLAPGHDPKPAPVVKFLVRAGRVNSSEKPVAEITSEPGGAFSLRLPAGDYCAILEDKRAPPTRDTLPAGADLDCMRERQRQCDAVISVSGPASGVAISRKTPCSWQDSCFPHRRKSPPAMD